MTHLVILSSVRWNFTWQRHHALARAAAQQGIDVIFVEPHPRGMRHMIHALRGNRQRVSQGISHQVPNGVRVVRTSARSAIPGETAREVRGLLGNSSPQAVQVLIYLPSKRFLRMSRSISNRPPIYDRVLDWSGVPDDWFPPRQWQRVETLLSSDGIVTTDSAQARAALTAAGVPADLIWPAADDEFLEFPWTQPNPDGPFGYFGALRAGVIDLDLVARAAQFRRVHIIGDVDEVSLAHLADEDVTFHHPVALSRLPGLVDSFGAIILPYRTDLQRDSLVPAKLWNCVASKRPILAQGIDIPPMLEDYIYPLTDEAMSSVPSPPQPDEEPRGWRDAWLEIHKLIQGAANGAF